MAIQAVVGNVRPGAYKPLCKRLIPFQNLFPLFEPMQLLGLRGPEVFGMVNRMAVELFIFIKVFNVRLSGKFSRRLEQAGFFQNGSNIGAHELQPPSAKEIGHWFEKWHQNKAAGRLVPLYIYSDEPAKRGRKIPQKK
jgi:hypothetical protein